MRQTLAVAVLQLRLTLKSKSALLMGVIMPLVLTLVFGLLFAGLAGSGDGKRPVYPIALLDQDQSPASLLLGRALAQEATFRVRPAADPAGVRRLLVDAEVSAAVVIPVGYGEQLAAGQGPPEVQFMAQPGRGGEEVAISLTVEQVAARTAADYRLARTLVAESGAGPDDPAALRAADAEVQAARTAAGLGIQQQPARRVASGTGGFTVSEQSLGFTVAFVMMLVFTMGGVILQERQRGTWGRLLTTPAGRLRLLLGYLLGFFITGWVQFGILLGAGRLLFGLRWGNPLQLAVVASAFILCSAGLGLFAAGVVRSAEQQQVVGTIVVVATSMLGGVYWPLEYVGETMRRIAYLTPQAWAMDAFRVVMLRGGDWSQLIWPLVVLLTLAVVFLAAGIARVRFE